MEAAVETRPREMTIPKTSRTSAKKKETIKFKAKRGAPFPQDKAQEVGEALENIRKRNDGKLKPDYVVKHASNPKSVLHPYFDWNADSAAKKWRKHQARLLINHVEVVYTYHEVEEHRPMFINISVQGEVQESSESLEKDRAYFDYVTVASTEEYRQQALKDALTQLISWKKKYQWLNELHNIIKEINEFEAKLQDSPE